MFPFCAYCGSLRKFLNSNPVSWQTVRNPTDSLRQHPERVSRISEISVCTGPMEGCTAKTELAKEPRNPHNMAKGIVQDIVVKYSIA